MRLPASVAAAPARPKSPRYGSDMMPLRSSFSRKCHDDSGGGAIHANLEALDGGIEPTWQDQELVAQSQVLQKQVAAGFQPGYSQTEQKSQPTNHAPVFRETS
ncbi:MAG: hypothetical protein ACLQVW_14805 [Limisphaerales bacterium]